MALLNWKAEYETGIPAVDYEHQVLIASIKEMAEKLDADASLGEILQCLGGILARIEAHFALEEKIMRDRKFDSYMAHKADHDRLLEDIRDIMDSVRISNDVGKIKEKLINDIDQWFSVHFLSMDLHYHKKIQDI